MTALEHVDRPKCSLICSFYAKYIVTSPLTLRDEFRCGIHAKRWLKDHPMHIRPIKATP